MPRNTVESGQVSGGIGRGGATTQQLPQAKVIQKPDASMWRNTECGITGSTPR